MAAVPLPVVVSDRSGGGVLGAGTLATAGTPFTFPNSGNQILRIKWTAAETNAVVAYAGNAPDGLTVSGKTLNLTAGSGDTVFGPFPVSLYGSTISITGPALATTSMWVIQSQDVFN